jgi:16S rRNA (adenine1518-N6/adenine1519-N6)-dimethyltransferase
VKLPVSPKRDLGQHFLVDENILGVIGRLADLGADDVVLEVGPGLGGLTDYLAERVAQVHAVELDRSLEAPLRERLAARSNVELHFGDAMRLDLATLEPTKFVSNLPYNVATPLIVESLDGLPSVGHWTVMVQREVADRLFAQPRTKAYGGVSVLIQLATERTGFHPVSRTVFRPQPNVDSALVAFRRIELPAEFADVKRQTLAFDNCSIDVQGVQAEAVCAGRVSVVTKSGQQAPAIQSRRWTFTLVHQADTWKISTVARQ